MTEDTCPSCSAQVRYSIATDSHICCGCGKAYAWPIYPEGEAPTAEPSPEETPAASEPTEAQEGQAPSEAPQ